MRRLSSVPAWFRAYVAGWHRSRYLNKPEFEALESRVVWIFGTPRSGSTWLLEMLAEAGAPGVATIDETWAGDLFNRVFAWPNHGTLEIVSSAEIHANLAGWVLGPEREPLWRPLMRAFLLEGFEHQLVHGQARTDWRNPYLVVKEPNTSQAADTLVKLLPSSRVVFLVRDGRDVVDSMLDYYTSASWGSAQELGWGQLPAEERSKVLVGTAAAWVYRMDAVQRACELVGPDRFSASTPRTARRDACRAGQGGRWRVEALCLGHRAPARIRAATERAGAGKFPAPRRQGSGRRTWGPLSRP